MASGETACAICWQEDGKYRCPKCRIRYCSVTCFASHNEHYDHAKDAKIFHSDAPISMSPEKPKDDKARDYMLNSPTLQLHLRTIVQIMRSGSHSKEQTQDKALNTIAELRINGARENEEFEEFARHIVSNANTDTNGLP